MASDNRYQMRLAEEYDAAQDRGEVATGNRTRDFGVADNNAKPATAADLGLRRDEIHAFLRTLGGLPLRQGAFHGILDKLRQIAGRFARKVTLKGDDDLCIHGSARRFGALAQRFPHSFGQPDNELVLSL